MKCVFRATHRRRNKSVLRSSNQTEEPIKIVLYLPKVSNRSSINFFPCFSHVFPLCERNNLGEKILQVLTFSVFFLAKERGKCHFLEITFLFFLLWIEWHFTISPRDASFRHQRQICSLVSQFFFFCYPVLSWYSVRCIVHLSKLETGDQTNGHDLTSLEKPYHNFRLTAYVVSKSLYFNQCRF